ncbi:hypothetical protein HY497_00185 [Candidatus Woesearchaeota archaeon]|nr:hypothetical protein [Candidatus Woesearchaeota archaeon]
MLTISTILKHYKRKEVQEAMVLHSKDREVAARYSDAFGTRPDAIQYENDILELVKQGATSFHCSEERWRNALQLLPTLKPRELAELRSGWDLVIDIDCKNWEYSKTIASIIVKLIKSFGIHAVSVKFSGNKGFHIGVPFEAFPKKVHGKSIEALFPEGPRRIAIYLIHLLEEKFFDFVPASTPEQVAAAFNLKIDELITRTCAYCNRKKEAAHGKNEFICPSCDNQIITDEQIAYKSCEKCGKIMVKQEYKNDACANCGKKQFVQKFDAQRIIDIDTLLISSRHLYRAPYSLHEKSGLVSVPIDSENVLDFDKERAKPENIAFDQTFLSRMAQPNEAQHLFMQAFDYTLPQREEEKSLKEMEVPGTAIPEQFFPECIQKISRGLEDGKKRGLFVLINFLRSVGWPYEQVEKYVYEWNKKNGEQLRENYIVGQLRYAKTKKAILPPNCSNIAYYQSLGVKCAENICVKCKNPVSRAKMLARVGKKEEK